MQQHYLNGERNRNVPVVDVCGVSLSYINPGNNTKTKTHVKIIST